MLIHKRAELVEASLRIIRSGQTKSGAFIACPSFAPYRYCWFRDGTFIAQALDLWNDHESAGRFYDWGVRTILTNRGIIARVLRGPVNVAPTVHLHTRYKPDGSTTEDEWPTFQLDGFGTFLWGMSEHLRLSGRHIEPDWLEAADLVIAYLTHLWRAPNFDCWEEHPHGVHISTVAALHGGAAGLSQRINSRLARSLADETRQFIVREAATHGYLPKSAGSDAVDASLLWATVPFNVLNHSDSVMVRTVEKIEADLLGPSGGLHRYAADTYYGGGEWVLLTALLGEYWLRRGDSTRPLRVLAWIEEHAANGGQLMLAEQVPLDLIAPDQYAPWVERWGPVACPLLWSHAGYLRLEHALAA